jgi:hypothetical protein
MGAVISECVMIAAAEGCYPIIRAPASIDAAVGFVITRTDAAVVIAVTAVGNDAGREHR